MRQKIPGAGLLAYLHQASTSQGTLWEGQTEMNSNIRTMNVEDQQDLRDFQNTETCPTCHGEGTELVCIDDICQRLVHARGRRNNMQDV